MKSITHSKPFTDKKDVQAVAEQVKSGMHATGMKTKEFESAICNLIGVKYSKAVNSGTNAIHIALLALGIKEGDEVILPSYACQAVLNPVNYIKAKPVFADIDDGFSISAKTIKPLITKKTKAVILPHLFGIPADINPIIKLGIPVIEDCAQALGVEYNGKKLGSRNHIGIFSFYATKIISTGHGGMVVTNSKEIMKKINDLTKYDQKDEYTIGYNFSFTDIQAALGISQLKKLSMFIKKRKQIAKKYNSAFKKKFNLVNYPKGAFPYRYLIQLDSKEEREKLQRYLAEKNIKSESPIFKPLHQYFNLPKSNFKNTEKAQDTLLSIPIYPALTNEEVKSVIFEVSNYQ